MEALDGIRARRQLVVRALTPVLLFVCVLGVTLQLRGADTRTHPGRYRIAVEGDFAGAKATLARLRADRLDFYAVPDAKIATIDEADAGMHIPDHLDTLFDDGAQPAISIQVFEATLNASSRAAAVLIQSAFVDTHATQVQVRLNSARSKAPTAGQPSEGALGAFAPLAIDVERTVAGTRTLTSQVIPGLICLQAALLVTGTANRLVSRRTRGLLTSQLLLPVSRRRLCMAKGLGEFLIGGVTAAPVVAAIIGFGAIIAVRDGSTLEMVAATTATVISMVALFGFMTVMGVLIGTVARTQEQVSLATGAVVILAALVATTIALGVGALPTTILVIPFAGIVDALREVLNGTGSLVWFSAACASTLFAIVVVGILGGRFMDAERLVMRDA